MEDEPEEAVGGDHKEQNPVTIEVNKDFLLTE